MIKKNEAQFEQITSATCDCCNQTIKVTWGNLEDHMKIGGYQNGKILEAVVCIKCMEEKFSFVKIQKRDNPIGYC